MTKPLVRADLEEAMRKLEENNAKQNPLPERLTQAFVRGSGYWGWMMEEGYDSDNRTRTG